MSKSNLCRMNCCYHIHSLIDDVLKKFDSLMMNISYAWFIQLMSWQLIASF